MFLFLLFVGFNYAYDFYIISQQDGRSVTLSEISSSTFNISQGRVLNVLLYMLPNCATHEMNIYFVSIGMGSNNNLTLYCVDYHGNVKNSKSYHSINSPIFDKKGNLYAITVNYTFKIIQTSNNQIKYTAPRYDWINIITYDRISDLYYLAIHRLDSNERYIQVMKNWRFISIVPMNSGQILKVIISNKALYILYVFVLNKQGYNQLLEVNTINHNQKVLITYTGFSSIFDAILIKNEIHSVMNEDLRRTQYWITTNLDTLKYTNHSLSSNGQILCIF
jgi:hypothetical protein